MQPSEQGGAPQPDLRVLPELGGLKTRLGNGRAAGERLHHEKHEPHEGCGPHQPGSKIAHARSP